MYLVWLVHCQLVEHQTTYQVTLSILLSYVSCCYVLIQLTVGSSALIKQNWSDSIAYVSNHVLNL